MIAIALALLVAEAPAFEKYQVDNETTCLGKADQAFEKADAYAEGGFKFALKGAVAEVHAAVAPKDARLGLIAAIKDFSPDTRANLTAFLNAFRKAGVS